MGQWPVGVIPAEGTLAGDDLDRAGDTFADPRRDGTLVPRTGTDTAALIEGAVESLVILRCPMGLGDAGAVVSCLVSLIAEAQGRLPDAVADARDQDRSWADIARRLGVTEATARRRYSAHARQRPPAPVDD